MADKRNLSRLMTRSGVLVTGKAPGERITGATLPELEPGCWIMGPDDIPGKRTIGIAGREMPLFADPVIDYEGMPVRAVFAANYEMAELLARDIKIETEKFEPEEEEEDDTPRSLEYGWGSMEEFREGRKEQKFVPDAPKETPGDEEKAEDGDDPIDMDLSEIKEEPLGHYETTVIPYRKIDSDFTLGETESGLYTMYTALCWFEGPKLHVKVPSQYPEFVRTAVAETCGLDKSRVVVHNAKYTSPNDEFLLQPAMVSAIAASALMHFKDPVELRVKAHGRRGAVRTRRTTYLSDEGRPVAEEVEHTVDMGAYAFLPEEYQRQAMTGLIPSYQVSAFRAVVKIEKTASWPYFIFGGMGYPEALASTEYHVTELAKKLGATPTEFMRVHYREQKKFTDYLPQVDLTELKKLMESAAQKSSFDRKWTAASMQKNEFGLIGYKKGIGIATGIGIAGFSSTLVKEHRFQAKLTYTSRGTVSVNSSAHSHGTAEKFWKKTIREQMGLPSAEDITFVTSDMNPVDSGPKVLSRFVCNFSRQLAVSARMLAELKEKEKPPFSVVFGIEDRTSPTEFKESGLGAMVTEIKISEENYKPCVQQVWAEFSLSRIVEEKTLMNSIKRVILRTIHENGFRIDPKCRINITVFKRDTDSIASTMALAKGLTVSALMNALSQATGGSVEKLPTSSDEVLTFGGQK